MVEKAGWDVPFHHNSMSLGSGDILVVQPRIIADEGAANAANRASGAMSGANCKFASRRLTSFSRTCATRARVSFREVSSPRDEKLSLDLSKSMSYDDVCAALADALGVADATTLRLTQHNAYTNAPKTPLAFRGIDALTDALPPRSGLEPARGRRETRRSTTFCTTRCWTCLCPRWSGSSPCACTSTAKTRGSWTW